MSVRELVILGCAGQQPTRKRNQGGYLLRWGDEGFLIDPGEGIQRQFIFANIAPTCVSHILVSHFHGDHCLGLGSMIMRLNLDGVEHPIACYYPESGEQYFNALRYGTIYHERIKVSPRPLSVNGDMVKLENFSIEACKLDHVPDTLGWKIKENDKKRFNKEAIASIGFSALEMQALANTGRCTFKGREFKIDDVTDVYIGSSVACILDTRPCLAAEKLAAGVDIMICDSTFGNDGKHLARRYKHMTATEAAILAKKAKAKQLVLTHYSSRYLDEMVLVREAKSIFPNVIGARDFLRLDIPKSTKV